MLEEDVVRKNSTGLLRQREESSERTRQRLHEALDRFEHAQLVYVPPGAKLTVRNLAEETGVSKDTPLSRYRTGHPRAGEYRFPDVVKRFVRLKGKGEEEESKDPKDEKVRELRKVMEMLKQELMLAHHANNQLDAQVYEKDGRIRELEKEVKKLRREGFKVLPFGKGGNRGSR